MTKAQRSGTGELLTAQTPWRRGGFEPSILVHLCFALTGSEVAGFSSEICPQASREVFAVSSTDAVRFVNHMLRDTRSSGRQNCRSVTAGSQRRVPRKSPTYALACASSRQSTRRSPALYPDSPSPRSAGVFRTCWQLSIVECYAERILPQLFDIAERERVPKILALGTKNQLRRPLLPPEDCRSGCLPHRQCMLRATPAKVATHPSAMLGRVRT